MPLSDLLMANHILRLKLFDEGLQADEYIPQLDVMKFVYVSGAIRNLARRHGVDHQSLQAYRVLHETFHKLLSVLTASYWLYCLELRSSGAFTEAAHLAATKLTEETITRLRELKETILLCEGCASILQGSIEPLHEAFIALILRTFGQNAREKEAFERIGKTYIAQIAGEGRSKNLAKLYKKMRWLMRKHGKDFVFEIIRASLNIPVINFKLMEIEELATLLRNRPYRFSPLRRFQKIVQLLQEKQGIRDVEDLSGWLWALGLAEKMPVKLRPLSIVGSPKRLGLYLVQRPFESGKLVNYLPYWDYSGANIAYNLSTHITYDGLSKLPPSAVVLTEGHNLYYRYGRKRRKYWPGHCYLWKIRDDLEGLGGYLYLRFIEIVLKDQVVALSFKKYEGIIPKLEHILCMNKEFERCFYGAGKVRKGYTEYKEKKCTACVFYPLVSGAQKLCSIFPEIPSKFG